MVTPKFPNKAQWYARLALLSLACLLGYATPVWANSVTFAAAPSWVIELPMPTGAEPAEEQLSGGVHYLLVDWQTRETAIERELYSRYAIHLLDRAGLDDHSSFTIEFDPRYQSVVIHAAHLLREGVVVDQAQPDRLSVFQRESDLEKNLLDGRLTAQLIFDDVRLGDIVEYSYTLHGKNPALQGHIGTWQQLAWAQPVGRRHARVLVPAGVDMWVQVLATDQQAVQHEAGQWQEFTWDAHDLAGRKKPGDVPAWFQFHPVLELSNYAGWADLQQWGADIYTPRTTVTPAVEEVAQGLRERVEDDPAQLAMAALHFVQEEIRYLGIEMGESGYVPIPPDETLARRYGDCKGKTVLLLSLLEALGVNAAPALAHTENGKTLDQHLPSPLLFNHVIVVMDLDGQRYFLDPTITGQATRLDTVVQPNYGLVLPLDGKFGDGLLDTTPQHNAGMVRIDERLVQDGATAADLEIATVYTGAEAEKMRRWLAAESRQAVTDQYAAYMSEFYPGLESTALVQVEDKRADNRLATREAYRVATFWKPEDDTPGSAAEASLFGWQARSWLQDVDTAPRTVPVARAYPARMRHVVDLDLGEGWDLSEEQLRVEDPQFTLERKTTYRPGQYRVEFTFEALDDHVPAEARQSHRDHLDEAWNLTEFSLSRYAQGATWAGADWKDAGAPARFWLGAVLLGLVPLMLMLVGRAAGWRHWLFRILIAPYREYAALPVKPAVGVLVGMVAGINSLLANLTDNDLHADLTLTGLVVLGVLGGVVAGLLNSFLGGTVWGLAARLLKGKGGIFNTICACGWGQLPVVLHLPVTLVTVAVLGEAFFDPDKLVVDEFLLRPILLAGWGISTVLVALWSIGNTIATVAVVHQISRGRSLAAGLVGGCLVLLVVVVPVGLIVWWAVSTGAITIP